MVTDNREESQQKGTSPRGRERLVPHTGQPNPWYLHGRQEPPKHLGWKTKEADICIPKELQETEIPPLGGFTCSLVDPETQEKNSLRSAYAIRDRDSFANLGALAEEQETGEMLTREGGTAGHHCHTLHITC